MTIDQAISQLQALRLHSGGDAVLAVQVSWFGDIDIAIDVDSHLSYEIVRQIDFGIDTEGRKIVTLDINCSKEPRKNYNEISNP